MSDHETYDDSSPSKPRRSRQPLLVMAALLLSSFSGLAFAGYADDRAEIENLSNKYMVAVDAGDIETVMSTWADDGVLDWVGGVEHGAAAIRKAMSGFGGSKVVIPENATTRQRTQHQIVNHVIDVKGDKAVTTAYWFALTNNTPQKNVELLYFGHYEDTLERRNGKWLFTKRKVYNESMQNRALFYPGLGEKDTRSK